MTDYLQVDLSVIGHGAATCAFLLVAALLAVGWRGSAVGIALIAACLLTALWGGAVALAGSAILGRGPAIAEIVRTGSWLVLLLLLRRMLTGGAPLRALWRDGLFLLAIGLLVVALAEAAVATPPSSDGSSAGKAAFILRLGLAVTGLLLLENIFKAAGPDGRWNLKHLVIGLGGIFAFDLIVYSQAVLIARPDPVMLIARPLVNLAAIPFLVVAAARIRHMSMTITVSRTAVLHTTVLIGSGLYLIAIAVLGYVVRAADLTWGPVMQVLLVAAAAMALVAVLLSGRWRAVIRRVIAENFFTFAFDYRREWLRFIATIAAAEGSASLHERAVRAVADVFECSAGALFLRRADGGYELAGRWNWSSAEDAPALPPAIVDGLTQGDVLEVADVPRSNGAQPQRQETRDWLAHFKEPWFLVPLRQRENLLGAVLLGQPRLSRSLTWEDRDLLAILGVQIASYVAEEAATRALSTAQEFERVGKRFTFIAHDLKNLVSQLTLVLHHAERHGSNPEFLRDALTTVKGSVDKMQGMLARLKESTETEALEPFEIGAVIGEVIGSLPPLRQRLVFTPGPLPVVVRGDRAQLMSVARNLLQNAVEATGLDGRIDVAYACDSLHAIVEIRDDGQGANRSEIQARMFQPFRSTKSGGYGVGLYQCREVLAAWGGRLEIESEPGRGTSIRIRLPLASSPGAPEMQTPLVADGRP